MAQGRWCIGGRSRTAVALLAAMAALFAMRACAAPGASESATPGASGAAARVEPVVLIGLKVGVAEATIACDGAVRVWRRGSGLRGSELRPGCRLRVQALDLPDHAGGGMAAGEGRGGPSRLGLHEERLGPLGRFTEDLILEPLDPQRLLEVDGRAYRGEIVVHAGSRGLTIVNAVRIESYLRGVVPAELGRGAQVPAAALEAQAIAARSYALYYLRRHGAEGFDLAAGPADQVYEGADGESPGADAALEATRGVVATHAGRPIRANYSSTCGGRTESAGQIWRGGDLPYLKSERDRAHGEDLCAASPFHRWSETWPVKTFEPMVIAELCRELPAAAAAGPTRLQRLEIRGRTPSGRVRALAIHTDRGVFEVPGDRVRWILRRPGGQPLRSALIGKLTRGEEDGRDVFRLEGAGYGHGVGLCQYGAMGMARQGASAEEILAHYYRNIRLVRWW